MTTEKHAQNSWRVIFVDFGRDGYYRIDAGDRQSDSIAEVSREEDAYLMAASKKMKAALEGMLRQHPYDCLHPAVPGVIASCIGCEAHAALHATVPPSTQPETKP